MVRVADPRGLQAVINEDIVDAADLLVVFFSGVLGATRGTVREIERFIELGLTRRIVIYVKDGGKAADDDLAKFLTDKIKPIMRIFPYVSEAEVPALLQGYFWKRIGVTLAAPYISDLHATLTTNERAWGQIDRTSGDAPEGCYLILSALKRALSLFLGRGAGRPLPSVDNPAMRAAALLESLIRDHDKFVSAVPYDLADNAIVLVRSLTSELPSEAELL